MPPAVPLVKFDASSARDAAAEGWNGACYASSPWATMNVGRFAAMRAVPVHPVIGFSLAPFSTRKERRRRPDSRLLGEPVPLKAAVLGTNPNDRKSHRNADTHGSAKHYDEIKKQTYSSLQLTS